MAAPVRLREDFDGPRLRALARRTRDAGQLRWLLAAGRLITCASCQLRPASMLLKRPLLVAAQSVSDTRSGFLILRRGW